MKKLLFLLFFACTLGFIALTSVHAQEGYDPLDPQFQEAIESSNQDSEISLPSATANTTMSNVALGVCVLEGGTACVPEGSPLLNYYKNYGLIPNIQNANIAMMLNPPANTGTWIADTGRSLGFLPKQANAQGIGFNGLSPVLPLWKTFRNLSYVLLALMMMVVGFMIMFRTRIDPHTVANIQVILPRVVISLILITFSYAIVGLLIDLSYVIIFFAYNLFVSAGLPTQVPGTVVLGIPTEPINTQQVYLTGSLLDQFQVIFPQGLSDLGALAENLTGIPLNIGTSIGGLLIGGVVGSFLGPLGTVGGALAGASLPLVVQLLLGLLLLILIMRIFFMFLSAYVQIILLTILGPVYLVLGTIPGQNNFTSWIRTVAANISVFVVTGIMFMLSATFNAIAFGPNQAIWSPPYFPFHIMTNNVGAFFVLGVLMLIPSIVKQVKQAIIGEQNANILMGGAIFSGLAGATALGMQAFNMWRSEHHNKELQHAISGKSGGGHPPSST